VFGSVFWLPQLVVATTATMAATERIATTTHGQLFLGLFGPDGGRPIDAPRMAGDPGGETSRSPVWTISSAGAPNSGRRAMGPMGTPDRPP
jgi:hypothetical protein